MGSGETGDVDFTPSGFLSGASNAVAGLEAATAALRAFFRPGNPRANATGARLVAAFDDDMRQAVQRSSPLEAGLQAIPAFEADPHYWSRWLVGVREASATICDAYASLPAGDGLYTAESRQRVARRLADSVKWNLCDRLAPDAALWSRLGAHFANEADRHSIGSFAGDAGGVVREYIRALAYHSAALDQLPIAQALAVARLVQLSLPFLSLCRKPASGPHYEVSPAHAPIPRRQLQPDGSAEWHFVPFAAGDLLMEFETQFRRGRVPRSLAGAEPVLFAAAARHLRRMWSSEPPQRRFRRHETVGRLFLVRGFADCRNVLDGSMPAAQREATVANLGRHGVGAFLGRGRNGYGLDHDEIVALRFVDGEGWHLGLVRRLSTGDHGTQLGVEILSQQAQAGQADNGEASVDVILCDPLRRGEALRVIAAPDSLQGDVTLSVPRGGGIQKLQPLDAMSRGRGFDLRVYQVL